MSDFTAAGFIFIRVALNSGRLRAERKEEPGKVASARQVTRTRGARLRTYDGASTAPHREKSNFLHLPANCPLADALDWRNLSFLKRQLQTEGGGGWREGGNKSDRERQRRGEITDGEVHLNLSEAYLLCYDPSVLSIWEQSRWIGRGNDKG